MLCVHTLFYFLKTHQSLDVDAITCRICTQFKVINKIDYDNNDYNLKRFGLVYYSVRMNKNKKDNI